MKGLYIIIFSIITTLSCKAQTILPLDGPSLANKQNLPKPIFIKDVNNIRDTFYGIWQGTVDNKELTLYIYKIDDVPAQSLISDIYVDELFGYYIYKENGEEIINSHTEAQLHSTPETLILAPFQGGSIESESIFNIHFIDYGISMEQPDGTMSNGKGSLVDLINIENDNVLQPQVNFKLRNIGEVLGAYNYDFSIPTDMVLTKIANTPPPLD